MEKIKTDRIILRLNRISGQIQGVKKMITERRSCESVLLQISAIKAAVNNLGMEIARSALVELAPENREKLEIILKEVARI